MGEPLVRWPGDVPDRPTFTLDTDGDGLLDTGVTDDGLDLVVLTDLDADGLVDQIVRIGPDGEAHLDRVLDNGVPADPPDVAGPTGGP